MGVNEPFDSSLISLGVQLSYPKRATPEEAPAGDYDSKGLPTIWCANALLASALR